MVNNSFKSLSKNDKVDFYISIVVIALTGLMILAFTFPQNNNVKQATYSISNENPMGISDISIDNKTYRSLDKPFESRGLLFAPEKLNPVDIRPKSSRSMSNRLSIDKEPVEEKAKSETLYEIKPIQTDKIDSVVEEVSVDSSSINKFIIKSAQSEDADSLVENESSEIIQSSESNDVSKSCVIIIGAFKKTSNKEKLLNSLKSDGYATFTTPYKELTRVGIYQACDSNSISIALRNVRKKYAKDAMILVAE